VSKDIERIVLEIEKVPLRKVTTIVNGVDTDKFRPIDRTNKQLHGTTNAEGESAVIEREIAALRAARAIPSDVLLVGTVGRFSPEKEYPLLVRAFAAFHQKVPRSYLVLVGDGTERGAIEQMIGECGVTGHCLLSGVRSDVVSWLKCMDIFCLSSNQEGTSITLLEAGACGLPAVVTGVGGNGEIVQDGITGIVVPSGDEQALARAFEELAANESLRMEMGRRARRRIEERYSVNSMVERYCEIYGEATRR